MEKKRKQNMKMNNNNNKLPFNVQTDMNMKKSIEANTKLNMKMNVRKNVKMKLNTMLRMGNSRCCCALAVKQLSNVWLCAGPYLVMNTAEAHLHTVSGARDEQCKW
jgi:hypothetical protein